ncbi:MAG: hypothetical protein N2483_08205 [Burkholderiaceae bacterium]|nr:hypothetical protein [Burkholderiaceae bacterium]
MVPSSGRLAASNGSNGSALPWHPFHSEAALEAFEERAAIMEFDGGLNREDAERATRAPRPKATER